MAYFQAVINNRALDWVMTNIYCCFFSCGKTVEIEAFSPGHMYEAQEETETII